MTDLMKLGICAVCRGVATQTCPVCGAVVCIRCITPVGCKLCEGKKKT